MEEGDDEDNTIVISNDDSIATYAQIQSLLPDDNESEAEAEDYISELKQRSRKRRRLEDGKIARPRSSSQTTYTHLWRVQCKRGKHDRLAAILLEELRNGKGDAWEVVISFTLPQVREWVYCECKTSQPNPIFQSRLLSSSSVQCVNHRPVLERVRLDDRVAMFQLHMSRMAIDSGTWIIVVGGAYGREIGCVAAVHDWGLDVLVVPRVFPHEPWPSTKPRKRSESRHELWRSDGVVGISLAAKHEVHGITNSSHMKKSEYDHGLLVLECRRDSVVVANGVSLFIMQLFHESSHPVVLAAESRAPCPNEWVFEKGDLVEVDDVSFVPGIGSVIDTHTSHIEVNLDGKGTHTFPYCRVMKLFSVGDYVQCLEGRQKGHRGFVQSIDDFHVVALDKDANGTIKEFRAHKNCVAIRPTLVHPSSPKPASKQSLDVLSGRAPWLGSEVIVFPSGHPLRTQRGYVRDVICGQDNLSGLRIIMILDRYNPEQTNKECTVDYEHIVETQTKLPLRLYKPLTTSQAAFYPRLAFVKSGRELEIERLMKTTTGSLSLERPNTPLTSNEPYSAAWDPRSKTPPLNTENDSLVTSSHSPVYEHHGHWTSDFRLTGFDLRAKVGGKPKTVILQTTWDNSGVEAYMRKGKTNLQKVSPEVVEAMHPSTVRNYERWVVIKGPHAGKQVRSIRYEKGATPKMPIWWTVAVVEPVPQAHDELMGEELHLISSDLCLEDEDKQSQKENMQFSRGLREDGSH
ncbi:hypothetical protein F5146DRAFT_1007644 [Armillaria mellea]|nr:hypothetical protein F5146DRAFT_1007644 [Armillaria mellea]